MATKPLQDDPSGPDAEYSKVKTSKIGTCPAVTDRQKPHSAASDSRPLGRATITGDPNDKIDDKIDRRIPGLGIQSNNACSRPGNGTPHTITVSIGPGIDDGSANIFLQSDSIRNEGSWRAYLYRGTELRAGVPFADGYVELSRALPAGIYTVKLTSAGAPVLPALPIALEPFNLIITSAWVCCRPSSPRSPKSWRNKMTRHLLPGEGRQHPDVHGG